MWQKIGHFQGNSIVPMNSRKIPGVMIFIGTRNQLVTVALKIKDTNNKYLITYVKQDSKCLSVYDREQITI